jgi:hypothetical protein
MEDEIAFTPALSRDLGEGVFDQGILGLTLARLETVSQCYKSPQMSC